MPANQSNNIQNTNPAQTRRLTREQIGQRLTFVIHTDAPTNRREQLLYARLGFLPGICCTRFEAVKLFGEYAVSQIEVQ